MRLVLVRERRVWLIARPQSVHGQPVECHDNVDIVDRVEDAERCASGGDGGAVYEGEPFLRLEPEWRKAEGRQRLAHVSEDPSRTTRWWRRSAILGLGSS